MSDGPRQTLADSGASWIARVGRSPRCWLAAGALMVYSYFLPAGGWNEHSRLDLTMALVEQQSVAIDRYHLNTGDKSYCGDHLRQRETATARPRRGRAICSDKAPGASLVATLPYAAYRGLLWLTGRAPPRFAVRWADAGRRDRGELSSADRVVVNTSFIGALYVCGIVTSALPAMLAILLVVRIARRSGAGERDALWVGAIYGLATMTMPYATVFFGHQLAATALLAALDRATAAALTAQAATATPGTAPRVTSHDEAPPLSGATGWRDAAMAGLCVGCATLTEYPLVIAAVAVGLYLGWAAARTGRASLLWAYGAGGALVASLLGAYLTVAFGAPWRLGYGQLANPLFAESQSRGLFGVTTPSASALWGMLFGRHRGLFYASPVLALAPVGWIRCWRRARSAELVLWAALVGAFVLLNSSYFMWSGGAAAGPRHLVPIISILCLSLVGIISSPRGRLATLSLAAISVANNLALTAAGVHAPESGDMLVGFAWPVVIGQRAPVGLGNVASAAGLSSYPLSLLPPVALIALTVLLLARPSDPV